VIPPRGQSSSRPLGDVPDVRRHDVILFRDLGSTTAFPGGGGGVTARRHMQRSVKPRPSRFAGTTTPDLGDPAPYLTRCCRRPGFAAAELSLGRGIYLRGGRDHKLIVTLLRVKGKG
jgi:hypothetical protein